MSYKKTKVKKLSENQLRQLVKKVITEQRRKSRVIHWQDLPPIDYEEDPDYEKDVITASPGLMQVKYKTNKNKIPSTIDAEKMANSIIDVLMNKKIIIKGDPGFQERGYSFRSFVTNHKTTVGEALLLLQRHFKHIPKFEEIFEDSEQIINNDLKGRMSRPYGGALGKINQLTPVGREVANKVANKLNDLLDKEIAELEATSNVSDQQRNFAENTYRIKKMD